MPERTVFCVLEEAAEQYGNAPALHQPYTENRKRKLRTLSWIEYCTAAQEIAAGLRTLGIRKGDIVALNSETRLEFYLADLGIIANGSIAAALYPSYPPRDIVKTIAGCGARAVFLDEAQSLHLLRESGGGHWIVFSGQHKDAITFDQLRERGRRAIAADPGLIARLEAEVAPSDIAVLYLTSGATGEPKMALVTHQAIVANIDMGPAVLPIGPKHATVAFLPSAHIAQRVVIEYLPLRMGMPVDFAESLMKLPQDIRRVKPTILLAPPRMWERIYSTICTELRKRPAAARKAFYGALGLALAASQYRREGKPVPWRIRAPLKLAD